MGTGRRNDVDATSSTSLRRHVPAGNLPPPPPKKKNSKPWLPQYSKPSYAYAQDPLHGSSATELLAAVAGPECRLISSAPKFQCCYFCESSCLSYLSFYFDLYDKV